ncbi:TlpA family protein disulfide reductase [Tenacibaculum ovolyticum]|uniref:TlpA family protein disulfide reductase n=1 Tax=Tenacibaculum ovolyticum TaxID=104270 RepID=UPI001F2B1F4E|nr:TlpA disulfide reductase family protein [Tenacibaculum ovolyticum]
MKNIIPALLSITIGFALSFFGLNTFFSDTVKNDTIKTISKEVVVAKKEIPKEAEAPTEVANTNNAVKDVDTGVNLTNIQESFSNWNSYHRENIDLMSTFIALDDKGIVMDKGIFLTLLRTGAYISVKSEKEGEIQYQLVTVKKSTDEKIKKGIVSKATIAHHYFKMEGKKLPSYDFVDLDGNSHNKEDTKGKLLVLKCWFITCKICVEEFPQLNELVDKYKDNNVDFVSLAFDEKDKLIKFLETKTFKYVTVPNQKKYMSKKLKVKQYPTHIIVDSRGVIIKMVSNVKTLTYELNRILGKK